MIQPKPEYFAPSERHARYLDLAQATYDLAERCEDLDLLRDYMELAARCLRLAEEAAPSVRRHGNSAPAGSSPER